MEEILSNLSVFHFSFSNLTIENEKRNLEMSLVQWTTKYLQYLCFDNFNKTIAIVFYSNITTLAKKLF